MRRKTTFANIHVKNMTHVTELELNTRAFAPPFVHIPFIPVGRTKECQECAKIFLQVGSSAVRFKNVPLTTESKISLRSRSCSPAIITFSGADASGYTFALVYKLFIAGFRIMKTSLHFLCGVFYACQT